MFPGAMMKRKGVEWPTVLGSVSRSWLFDPDYSGTLTLDANGRVGAMSEYGGDSTRSWSQATTNLKPATSIKRGRRVLDFESALTGAGWAQLVGTTALLGDYRIPRNAQTIAIVWIAPDAYGTPNNNYIRMMGAVDSNNINNGNCAIIQPNFTQIGQERATAGIDSSEVNFVDSSVLAAGLRTLLAWRTNSDGTMDMFINGVKGSRAYNTPAPVNSNFTTAYDTAYLGNVRYDLSSAGRTFGYFGAAMRFNGAVTDTDISTLSSIASVRYP